MIFADGSKFRGVATTSESSKSHGDMRCEQEVIIMLFVLEKAE